MKQLNDSNSAYSKKQGLFSGVHEPTGEQVTVRHRTDRGKLVSMYQNKKQICQTVVSAELPLAAAEQIMIGLAKDYCNTKINMSSLKDERDSRISTFAASASSD